MSDLSLFLKKNKKQKPNTTYAPTKSMLDEEGNPLVWTIKPLTTKENEKIRESCMYEVPVKGRKNVFRPKLNVEQYIVKMIVVSVVEPNLYNAELQDSYGVTTPEDLVKEMVDDPGEYNDFAAFIQEFNGFSTDLDDEIEQAKN